MLKPDLDHNQISKSLVSAYLAAYANQLGSYTNQQFVHAWSEAKQPHTQIVRDRADLHMVRPMLHTA